jgi:hypothetical protein
MKTLWLVVGLLFVTACTESQTPPSQSLADREPAPTSVLLTYERSGGFTGSTDGLTIRADGRATISGDQFPSGRFTLSDARLMELKRELSDLDWERAADEPPNVVCADCFVYDISSGQQRVTTTANGQSGRELGDLLALVDSIIASSDLR